MRPRDQLCRAGAHGRGLPVAVSLLISDHRSRRRSMAEFIGGSTRDSKEASLSGALWSIGITLGPDRSGVLSFEYNGRMLDYLVLGRSEYDRSPLERYGHTPTGTYSIPKILITGPGTKLGDKRTGAGLLTYGHEGAIVLQPEGGEALDAFHKGRRVFLIHAGD